MADDPRQPSDDPRQAGAPRTKGPTRAYENDRIRVLWDASRCIHVGSCLRALPSVFDVRARPWVDLDGAPAEEVAAAAVQYAYDKLGQPYRWGATGELGFYDCSGLMLRAYQKGGLQLPRTSRQQWYAGARVWNVADRLPGDLVFYAYNTADPATIHHVGIYIGAGNMIDAPYTGANVRITPFLRGDYIGAVRPTAGQATAAATTTTTTVG